MSAASDVHLPPLKSAVIVGFGPVGQMVTTMLAPHGWSVRVVEPRPRGSFDEGAPFSAVEHYVEADAREATPDTVQLLADCSLLVLAVPEGAAFEIVEALMPVLPAEVLLLETLSKKARLRARLTEVAPEQPLLSINPLFHPRLGPRGNRVAVVDSESHPVATDVLSCIEHAGSLLVSMSLREHDEDLVAVQSLTHSTLLAFSAALPQVVDDIDRCMDLAPPPTRLLMALAARVSSGSPETYWDIQSSAPDRAPARDILLTALRRFSENMEQDSAAMFARSLEGIQAWYGSHLTALSSLAQVVLSHTYDDLGQQATSGDQAADASPLKEETDANEEF